MTHCSLHSRALIEAYLSLRMAVLPLWGRRRESNQTEAKATQNKIGVDAKITDLSS